MVEEPVVGAIYWCILPPDESVGGGDDRPRRPWQGKLVKSVYNALLLCRFNAETGAVDDDANARSHVRRSSLHATELAAMQAYLGACKAHVQDLREDLSDAVEERDWCENRVAELKDQKEGGDAS